MEIFHFLGRFASAYLILQLIVFITLIAVYNTRIRTEKSAMKQIEKSIVNMDRRTGESPGEIERQLNTLFKKQKDSKYKMLWNRYYERSLKKESDERMNVEPFFGFDVMNHHLGKRAVMDIGSGLHVSLGVLGTFIGLSFGLMELQVDDTERLRNGIGNLLNGMKTAFYTSVLGVILSIVWTVLDRVLSSKVEDEVDWHSEKLNYLLSTDDEEIFLSRMEKISKNQADHLKTLLTDALEKAMQPLVSTIQQSNGTVTGAIEGFSSQMQTEMNNQAKVVEAQTRNLVNAQHQAFTELSKFNLKRTHTLKNEVTTALNGLSTQIGAGTQSQSALIEKQTMALQKSISPVISTVEQSNESMTNALGELLDQMQTKQTGQAGAMEPVIAVIQQLNETIIHKFSEFSDQLGGKLDNQSALIEKQTEALQKSISPVMLTIEQSNEAITNALGELVDRIQTKQIGQAEAMEPVTAVIQQLNEMIIHKLDSQSALIEKQTNIVQTAFLPVTLAAEQINGEITSILKQLADQMQTNPQLQEKILESQAEVFKQTVAPIVSVMEHSNESVTNVLEKLSNQLINLKTNMDEQWKTIETKVEVTKNESQDAANKLITQVTGETEQSLNQFTDILQQSQTLQNEMVNMMQKVAGRFLEAEAQQAATTEKTESILISFTAMASEMDQIKHSYQEATGFMTDLGSLFQNIQSVTAEQLPIQQEMMKSNHRLMHKYDDLIEGLHQFQFKAEEQYGRLLSQAAASSNSMVQSFEAMTEAFQESLHTQKETISHSEALLGSVQNSASTLGPIAEEFRQAIQYMDAFGEQLQNMQAIQSDLLPELVKFREETNKTAIHALEKTGFYIENMTEQLTSMRENWETTKEQFQETTQALHLSMKDFEGNIEGGLSKTYHHFDETLTMAVKETSGLIYQFSDAQKEFIEQFEDATEALVKWKAESVI